MDKYLLVVMGVLMIGIPIAFLESSTGELRDQPLFPLFWESIGGIITIIVLRSYNNMTETQNANRERSRRK